MRLQAEAEDRGLRLDVFLARHLPELTRSHIQSLNRSGLVQIDGRVEKAGYKLRGTEQLEIEIRPLERLALEPQQVPLGVLYEDADLAVIEKPAGVAVHPGAGTPSATLVHGLLYHFKSLSGAGGEARPGIVHRLDKWTSGLMVIAKTDSMHARLSRAFQDRKVEKTYIALVHGKLPRPEGEIRLNIGRHASVRTRMSARTEGGRQAWSSYRRIDEFRGFSLLEVRIHTGRTHQIRVHLSAIGHPVVGDDVYGERKYTEFVKKYGKPCRYFLHASRLRFMHPATGVVMEFASPLPGELNSLLERLRF